MQAKRIFTLGTRLALIALAGASLVACDVVVSSMNAKGKAQDEWSRTYPIAPDGRVEVTNISGTIEVLGTSGQQVEVRAVRIARANTDEAAKELLRQVEIKEDHTQGLVRLETVMPSGTGFRSSGSVRYYLKVPAAVSVRIRNTNGQVRVEGVKGSVHAETTNGGVRGRALAGEVQATTTNGGVDLAVDALTDGGIRAETTNGGVELTVPETVQAQLRATCVHGGVSVSGLTVDGETRRNLVEGKINGGGPRISLETTNGGIRVRAGASAK